MSTKEIRFFKKIFTVATIAAVFLSYIFINWFLPRSYVYAETSISLNSQLKIKKNATYEDRLFSELYDKTVFTITAMGKKYEFTESEIGVYKGKKYLKCACDVVDKIYLDTVIRPVDATITFLPDSDIKFNITKEKSGRSIIREDAIKDISDALNGGIKTLSLNTQILEPEVLESELIKITEKRGEFTTNFENSSINRKDNIRLATRIINGSVINPGEEFSFNKTVGARTVERGFKTAKIITDGKFVDGVGGGVCQVSTTLYNAALLSGMFISEQHSHSLAVSYVEPSFDAMVSSDYCDLKFKNLGKTPIFISAKADDVSVTFTFYGEKQTENFMRISKVIGTNIPNGDEIIYDNTLPFGKVSVKQNAKNGIESEGYIAVIIDGQTVKTEKIRSDKYKSVKRIVSIGTKIDNDGGKTKKKSFNMRFN